MRGYIGLSCAGKPENKKWPVLGDCRILFNTTAPFSFLVKYFRKSEPFSFGNGYIICNRFYDGRKIMTDKELIQQVCGGSKEALGAIIELSLIHISEPTRRS